jgi:ribosomal protein S18 acetylase RimI-like enzyme
MDIATTPDRTAALALLAREPLRHIVPLKMLRAYGHAIECRYLADGAGGAALLLLPTRASSWDSHAYPETDHVALLAAESPGAADALLAGIPPARMVFKLAGPIERAALHARLPVRRTSAFVSFTTPLGVRHAPSPEVLATDDPAAELLAAFAEHGHDPAALRAACAAGRAMAFATAGGRAACFATEIYDGIWEIGGLFTAPELRRQGHARRLVETALAALAARGLVIRYQVQEDNLASIRLAESAGLRPFVTVEHFVGDTRPISIEPRTSSGMGGAGRACPP